MRNKKGFTLIELLIVIAIIGILSSVVLVKLTGGKEKAKNSRKKAELAQISKLVQSYYVNEGRMPINVSPGSWAIIGRSYPGGTCLQELVDKGYINTLPTSPDGGVYYYYDSASVNPASNYGLVSSRMTPMEYGPGTRGYHCSNFDADKIYCIEFNK